MRLLVLFLIIYNRILQSPFNSQLISSGSQDIKLDDTTFASQNALLMNSIIHNCYSREIKVVPV